MCHLQTLDYLLPLASAGGFSLVDFGPFVIEDCGEQLYHTELNLGSLAESRAGPQCW